jgi:riboflavin synthase
MFTGIIEELGAVVDVADHRLRVACRTVSRESPVGASVAVNGVCLTVVERSDDCLAFDLSEETLSRTALGRLRSAHPVNLERSATLLTRLGGHLVQGHVDGVGRIAQIRETSGAREMAFEIPPVLMRYVVAKGSVALDGVSLTVARVAPPVLDVAFIPHTLAATTFGTRQRGDLVNVEVDVIAKYVEGLLHSGSGATGASG